MMKYLHFLFIFLLVVASIRFYEARFLGESIKNYFQFILCLTAILLSGPFVFRKPEGFVLPVQIILLAIVNSIVMAAISWDQNVLDSIKGTVPYMLWCLFFYLLHNKVRVESIEKIILICGIIYVCLYFYQFANSHTVLFGRDDEFVEQRGIIRIKFPGGGIFFLASFMALNKLTTEKRGRWLWLSLSILGLLIPIMQVTRQFIAATLLIYVWHFGKSVKSYRRVIVLMSVIGIVSCVYMSDNPIVRGLKETQERDLEAGRNYIRVAEGTYYLTKFSPDYISRVLGNGVPFGNKSEYLKFVLRLEKGRGFFLSDVGIIAVYVMFGVLAVLAHIVIWIKSITLPLPKEYSYVKYYLWFLFATCLTSSSVYNIYYLISTVFALYIYQARVSFPKHDRFHGTYPRYYCTTKGHA